MIALLPELVLAIGYVEVVYLAPLGASKVQQMLDPLIQALQTVTNHV